MSSPCPTKPPSLRIRWRAPQSLAPCPAAAKAHPEGQVRALAAAIEAFGLDQPLVATEKGVLIKGHCRREAALLLGLPQVPVILRHDLDEQQRRCAALADNRTAESHWLPAPLARELERIARQRPELLPACGFSPQQVQGLVQQPPPLQRAWQVWNHEQRTLEHRCPHCGEVCGR